jgi:predicted transcriptional regulator of viral defense system
MRQRRASADFSSWGSSHERYDFHICPGGLNVTVFVTYMKKPGLRPLYDLVAAQGGYFTTAQAKALGVSRRALAYRVEIDDLVRIEYGIYRLAHYPSQPFEDVIVACLWAGEDSAASHETALAVYGLADAMPANIHITIPGPFRGRRRGVIVHRAPLGDNQRTVRDGVPVTTVERTLTDVAHSSEATTVAAAAQQSLSRGLISARRLKKLAAGSDVLERALTHLFSRAG